MITRALSSPDSRCGSVSQQALPLEFAPKATALRAVCPANEGS